MPRKKAFSNKQKKKQLYEKRQKKRDNNEGDSACRQNVSSTQNNSGDSDDELNKVKELHHQPVSQKRGTANDPNRFLLKFGSESKAEIEERKRQSLQPIVWIEENGLEISIESIYRPGSVLDMPKRPAWNYKMSKERVERNEEEMFRKYKEKIYSEHKPVELSYFECNLETWRQLWRVLEVSDIVIIVADVRFPVLHFSPLLYKHVVEDLKKHVILLLNKIDLVSPELVVAWKHYFQSKFQQLNIVCFTSFPKDENERIAHQEKFLKRHKKKKRNKFAVGPKELFEACSRLAQDKVDLGSWEAKIAYQSSGMEEDEVELDDLSSSDESDDDDFEFNDDTMVNESLLTLGLVGHPNVGKSSLLNGLVGKKVVSTSRTPGHTKHFQTIFLTSTVRLCDSPGLVFPSLIDKQLQILAGLYPISQVQEPYTSVGYLAARWSLITLLHIVHPTDNESLNAEEKKHSIGKSRHAWSAWDICDAWAEKRGYMTAKAGRNDIYRAANSILRLAVDGKIPFYFFPPDFVANKDKWLNHPETKVISELQELHLKCQMENKEEELSQEESESDEEESKCVATTNPFALLSDE